MALSKAYHEILFRGQTRKFGEKVAIGSNKKLPGNWVYGGIFPGISDFSIIYGWEYGAEETGRNLKRFSVYSDTVGQYTGIADKNNNKIFEGDIVKTKYGRLCAVVWFSPKLCFDLESINRPENLSVKAPDKWDLWYSENLEVVGNIHDNPELLGGDSP